MSLGLDKFVISVIVFFVVIVAGVMIVNDVNTNYEDLGVDMNLDQYISGTHNISTNDNTLNVSESMHTSIFGEDVDSQDSADSMFTGGFSAIRLVTTPISLTKQIMNQIAEQIGIPDIFIQYASVAIIILVTFAVIFLIFRIKA